MAAATSLVFTIPSMAFVAFQAVFAIITVALISGAVADRALASARGWSSPACGRPRLLPGRALARVQRRGVRGGWLIANNLLAIDFAGGTAVHINAGAAGPLALVLEASASAASRCGRTTCRSS